MDKRYFAEIGIIGGTGVYDPGLFSEKRDIKVYTPFGDPSDLITVGEYARKKVAFIPRHGKGHRIPPHRINNRANIWALKELGVKRIIAPTAVGSMKYEYRPGDIAIPDQFVDFTKGRKYTFYDGGEVCHVSVADPFCPELRDVAVCHGNKLGYNVHTKATYVCIEGPRCIHKLLWCEHYILVYSHGIPRHREVRDKMDLQRIRDKLPRHRKMYIVFLW